jgi:uncharacterized protein
MKYKKFGEKFVVRLEKGEKVMENLTKFCTDQDIQAGSLSGIGALSQAEVQYYSLKDKEYHKKNFEDEFEVLNITGNISLVDDKPLIHAHITLSNTDFFAFGGHLVEATVGPTLEVIIEPMPGSITRKFDEEVGLKLIDL